ncbi:M20/M25/M40 family metallo-hydrolase [Leucobacter rhizosphaerae]|uniref:M20/M25/M40 family metallo-hydrolase n=1 Tax=Leucobacter rhizosphaerae TaxID=2932245 RepID=A0ABY4FYU2_9MICO|nr:M20/M25/M40 family metallo-hydrolase [Leucobacter rhizosphaerae]UOQ61473.1 M20/M25/M40 family metallo-hydrolase [Leucobacter rhizosphaerae]
MDFAQEMSRRASEGQGRYISDLSALVGIDSGSDDRAGVNRVADWVADRLRSIGFDVARHSPGAGDLGTAALVGDALVARRKGSGRGRIAIFAHMDTVFTAGDAAARPFSIDDAGLAHGPGVTDDKAGLVAGIHAAEHLISEGSERYGELVLVCTPDEEIGSPFGRRVLQDAVRDADAALCLECARENGDLVGSRKGVIDLELEVQGVAAHSGIEPERGAHAGLESAHLTVFLQSLADPPAGVTVNVGVLRAGDRLNIVPDRARLSVEMRAPRQDQLTDLMATIRDRIAAPVVTGTSTRIIQREECPPMERTAAGDRIGALATEVAASLGFTAHLAATGASPMPIGCRRSGSPPSTASAPSGAAITPPGNGWISRPCRSGSPSWPR